MGPASRGDRSARALALGYLGLVAIFVLAASALSIRDHFRVPFRDDWLVLDHYQTRELAHYLFAPENGHYLPATLALFAVDQEWLGGRMELLTLASLACTALAAGLLCIAFRRETNLSDPTAQLVLGFGVFSLFWAASCHDLLWGLNQNILQAVALVILSLGSLARLDPARLRASIRWLALSVAAALLATLSHSVGAASWAALVVAAAVRRLPWRVVVLLAAVGAVVVGLMAHSLPPHPGLWFAGSLRFAVQSPFAVPELAAAFVGSAPARVLVGLGFGDPKPDAPDVGVWMEHTRDRYRIAVAFGGAAFALFAVIVARARRRAPRSGFAALATGLMAFAIAGAFLVGFARAAAFGPATVVQLRFITWSTLFWIGAACALLPRGSELRAGPRARLAASLLPIASAAMLPALGYAREFRATAASQAEGFATALRLGLRHDELARKIWMEPELVFRVAARLEAGGRWPFDRARSGLRGASFAGRFTEAGACPGGVTRIRSLGPSEAATAQVWGWLSPPAGRAAAAFVVLVDRKGVIRGLADFAAAHPRARAVAGSERLAWAGFVADYDPAQSYTVHAVLRDGSGACRLASP